MEGIRESASLVIAANHTIFGQSQGHEGCACSVHPILVKQYRNTYLVYLASKYGTKIQYVNNVLNTRISKEKHHVENSIESLFPPLF